MNKTLHYTFYISFIGGGSVTLYSQHTLSHMYYYKCVATFTNIVKDTTACKLNLYVLE